MAVATKGQAHYYRNLPEQIEKVTAADTLRAAKEYLHPDATIVVAVGNRAKIEPGLKDLNAGEIKLVK